MRDVLKKKIFSEIAKSTERELVVFATFELA